MNLKTGIFLFNEKSVEVVLSHECRQDAESVEERIRSAAYRLAIINSSRVKLFVSKLAVACRFELAADLSPGNTIETRVGATRIGSTIGFFLSRAGRPRSLLLCLFMVKDSRGIRRHRFFATDAYIIMTAIETNVRPSVSVCLSVSLSVDVESIGNRCLNLYNKKH